MDFENARNTLVWNGQKEGIAAVFDMLNSDDDRIKWSEVKIWHKDQRELKVISWRTFYFKKEIIC